jgi:hypothetical protein
MEIFKKIIKNYEVSNTGLAKSLPHYNTKGIILKQSLNPCGYLYVHLGRNKQCSVHRLVAQAFIPNPLNKRCINHINGIKTDNRVENLEWCTHKENERHSKDILGNDKTGENNGNSLLKEFQVKEIRNKYIPRKYSIFKLAKEYRVSHGLIHLIITNKIWKNV